MRNPNVLAVGGFSTPLGQAGRTAGWGFDSRGAQTLEITGILRSDQRVVEAHPPAQRSSTPWTPTRLAAQMDAAFAAETAAMPPLALHDRPGLSHPRRRRLARGVHRRPAPVRQTSARPPLPRDLRRPLPSHRRSSTAGPSATARAGRGPAQAAQSLPGTGLPPAAGHRAHPPHPRTGRHAPRRGHRVDRRQYHLDSRRRRHGRRGGARAIPYGHRTGRA